MHDRQGKERVAKQAAEHNEVRERRRTTSTSGDVRRETSKDQNTPQRRERNGREIDNRVQRKRQRDGSKQSTSHGDVQQSETIAND